jgi:parallel beta-helix repeat protein
MVWLRVAGLIFASAGIAAAQRVALEQQNQGTAPQPSLDASDIYNAYQVPLNDLPGGIATDAASKLQVGERARTLGLTGLSPLEAWKAAPVLLMRPIADPAAPPAVTVFSGTTASALNAAIVNSASLSLRVASAAVSIDQPILVTREGFTLDLGSAQLTGANAQPYMLRIDSARNITVTGGSFTKGNSAILVSKSGNVVVDHTRIAGLTGDGVVVTGSNHVWVSHNRITGMGGPGIVLHTGTTLSTVEQNDISNGTGQSNWMAGILISDRDVDLASDPGAFFDPSGYWPVTEPIRSRVNPPRDNLVAFNHVGTNASSGIYVDGGVRTTIFSNTLLGNAKEGMCLDNGSTANVVSSNVIQQNGKRWGQTDDTLRLDYVSGRLPDGTAAAKLPGISLDNAIYNVIYANNISHNFGGGVKMVRTSFFNIVGLNVIENDNDGANIYFRFFGVEMGAAPGDASSPELDFTPSRGNVIFSNLIRGTHGSGIFLQAGSDGNDVVDNVILDAKDWAIEAVLPMLNTMRNNLTNLPSENGRGCCTYTGRRPEPGNPAIR